MNFLEIKDLSKRFRGEEILSDINLNVKEGEFFVILGPSGCGKTTLLKIIAGLLKPDRGSLILNGKDITKLEPSKRDIAMVFQNYALYPHMKVRDNILFPLRVRKVKKEEEEKSLKWVSEFLKIEKLLDKKPNQISGGEMQRVALARALIRKPKIFLMDEPLSNLDAKLRAEMREELKNLQRRLYITTIYVTHDQIEAMTLADRICVMHKGKIKQIGTPKEIYESPQDLFVASFVGNYGINIIESENSILCIRPEKFNTIRSGTQNYEFFVKIHSFDFLGDKYLLKGEIVDIVYMNKSLNFKKNEIKILSNKKPESQNLIFYVNPEDVHKFTPNSINQN